MFVKSFVMVRRGAGEDARAVSAVYSARVGRCVASSRLRVCSASARLLRTVARAAVRSASTGNPLTPTGYAILALALAAVPLAAWLSTSRAGAEPGRAWRLSGWLCWTDS